MAVMVTAEVSGQTREGYDAIRVGLEGLMPAMPGFIAHMSHGVDGGWRVIELWESKEHANDFFAKYVHPNLPPGIKPRRTFQDLHNLIRA